MNLRSVPLVLATELSKVHSGDSLVSRLTSRIIQRADEITELLAYYQQSNGRKNRKKLNRLSKQLPFRFLAAYRELSNIRSCYVGQLMDALEKAVMISARNIAGFDKSTKVLIACDVSGSMQQAISPKSKLLSATNCATGFPSQSRALLSVAV
jgi:hypothetical protein